MRCRICESSGTFPALNVREMMFGFRDEFTYFQCSGCKCLQIVQAPANMAKYYPSNYYSLESGSAGPSAPFPEWCSTMIGGPIIKFYALFSPRARSEEWEREVTERVVDYYFGETQVTRASRILDVGCGTGSFLASLRKIGFKNLLGLDPYLRGLKREDGVEVVKGSIQDLGATGEWDLIMFNHSFEHLAEPFATLRTALDLLSKEGVCLIRMPTVSSYAWEHYGANWVNLDAPRHLFLYSVEGAHILAQKAGLSLDTIRYDSTSLQFLGSEQYLRDIPFLSERSFFTNPFRSIFTLTEMQRFEKQAEELNLHKQGDLAAFYLTRN